MGRVAVTTAGFLHSSAVHVWTPFAAGDHHGFHAPIARHVRGLAGDADVAVLAQASTAPAAELLRDRAIPVLSGPRLAVLRAVEIAYAAGAMR